MLDVCFVGAAGWLLFVVMVNSVGMLRRCFVIVRFKCGCVLYW